MATAVARAAARRRLRSRSTSEKSIPDLPDSPGLLRSPGSQQLIDLPDGVVDLHLEFTLAEVGARAPGISGDAVVDARRRVRIRLAASPAALTGLRCGIAHGRLD